MNLYNTEAECLVIGGILIDGESINDVVEILAPTDFWDKGHQAIYQLMLNMSEEGADIDMFLLADKLDKGDGRSWLQYLAGIMKNTPGSSAIKTYALKVSEYAKLRSLYQSGVDVQGISENHALTLSERVTAAQESVLNAVNDDAGKAKTRRQRVKQWIQHLDECRKAGDGVVGIKTGFDSFDQRLGGLRPGGFYIIGARPAMGKTNLALNMARQAALINGKKVQFFSLEMPSDELFGRVLADRHRIPYSMVTRAKFDEHQNPQECWDKVTAFSGEMAEGGFFVEDPSSITMAEITSLARRQQRQHGVDIIFIDYLQLIDTAGAENETVAIGRISKSLKALAKQLAVPIVALSQLSRECDKRKDPRPIMSDIRSSGQIEQDADAIGFIYRDVVYNEGTNFPNHAEIIWRKVRAGATGTDFLTTEFGQCRFSETSIIPEYSTKEEGMTYADFGPGR